MGVGLTALGHSVVRVLKPDGAYVGLGYRTGAELVITCAHVVAEALGTHPRSADAPTGQVLLDAPFALLGKSVLQVPATVVPGGWLPMSDDAGPADLVLLQVSGTVGGLPLSGPLADLAPTLSPTGVLFDAYGGPQGHERHLIYLEGRVRAPIANGRWQLSARDSDYAIRPGCSGTPAIDSQTGQVIGLIAQDEQDQAVRAGFLIPSWHLRTLLAAAGLAPLAAPGLEPLLAWLNAYLRGTAEALAYPVRRFIDYYSGTPDRPMPFAGRDDALAILDQRLVGGGGAFILVSGAAGLGKSALLLHWMARQLRRNPDLRLLFLPVSIRFDTAAELPGLRLLHAQLATLFAEVAFPEGVKPDQEDYREHIVAGWEPIAQRPGERFLLVIDGADEASGSWLTDRVLPHIIPANLTVVLAARHKTGHRDGRAWLADFPVAPGCPVADPLELDPLPREAVGEAIVQLGHPLDALPARHGIVDALYRLTDQGDPLLVGLWAGEIWKVRGQAARLSAADLDRLEPGYSGFVSVWLSEQIKVWEAVNIKAHPDDLQRLLRVLALAHGPLPLRDWLDVAGRLPVRVPWDYETARRVLDNAYRLVVGDAERGYAFVHPRLADYFQTEIKSIAKERIAVPSAYLNWGNETVAGLNAGILRPDECPIYLLRHYTAHVLADKMTADEALDKHLLALLQAGWLRAWEYHEGAFDGYLADVQRVHKILRRCNLGRSETPYRIGMELRCALISSSFLSLTEHLPPALIVALAQAGIWNMDRAVWSARRLSGWKKRVDAMIGLADLLAGDARLQLLSEALAAARRIGDGGTRIRALTGLAAQLPETVRHEVVVEVLAAAPEIDDETERTLTLGRLLGLLAGERRREVLGEVLSVTRGIDDISERFEALMVLAWQLTGEEREEILAEALAAVRRIDHAADRVEGQMMLAWQLTGEKRREVLGEARSTARDIDLVTERIEALSRQLGSEARDMEHHAAWVAGNYWHDENLVMALTAMAKESGGLAPLEFHIEAVTAAYGSHWEFVWWVLNGLTERLAGQDHSEILCELLPLIRIVGDEGRLTWILTAVLEKLEVNQAFLIEALTLARGFSYADNRANALAAVARQMVGADRRKVLSEALAAVRDSYEGTGALLAVVGQLDGDTDLLRETLATADGVGDATFRLEILAMLVPQLVGEPGLLGDGLAAARSFIDAENRAEALVTLTRPLVGAPLRAILEEAMAVSFAIGDQKARDDALAALVGLLARESDFLTEAKKTVREIGSEELRSSALAGIAGQLTALGHERGETLDQVLALVREIVDEGSRVKELAALAGQFAGEKRQRCIEEAMLAAYEIANRVERISALAAVAGQLSRKERRLVRTKARATGREAVVDWDRATGRAALPAKRSAAKAFGVGDSADRDPAPRIDEFARRLDEASELPRAQFLGRMKEFLPAITVLGGGASIRETINAISDTGRWWP